MFSERECVICKKMFVPNNNIQNACSPICKYKRKKERDHISALKYRSVHKEKKMKENAEAQKKKLDLIPIQNGKAREKHLSYGQYKMRLFLESQKHKKALIREE